MTILNSPADADNFRMTKDYGRWYFDPLPGCDIAPATEDQWPSCSHVKKAADKDWSFLTVNRIAALEPSELHRIADLDHTQRGDAIRSHEKMAKNIAFGRGQIIHLWCEDLLGEQRPRTISNQWLALNGYPEAARDEAEQYRAAIEDFFDVYQPEAVAVEYVTIHRTLNGHGYGATPDCLARIEGKVVALDWKTRGPSGHAAYAEEAAQIACGARAEYMVVKHKGEAVRQRIPEVDGGYVVSIKPDGARLYPIDIDKAWEHWFNLHEWWTHRLDEKASIGRVKPKKSAPTMLESARQRMAADAERSPLHKALDALEAEGGLADQADVNAFKARFEVGMTPEQKAWTGAIVKQAKDAGVDFRITVASTQRRADIYSALTKFATSEHWDPDDDEGFRAALYVATGDESCFWPTLEVGKIVGSLSTADAKELRNVVDAISEDLLVINVDDEGRCRWVKPAAA